MSTELYYNGPIITMADDERETTALLVRDGRIVALGEAAWAQKTADTALIDLGGKTLLPAFIDAHSHLTAVALTLGLVDLSEARDFADIIARLSQFKAARQPAKGEWIIGFNYDHNNLAEKTAPTKAQLDQAATENPILISHTSGHMGAVNSLALAKLGITKDTPDPDGGKIGRTADGEPNGYLEENAFIAHSTQAPRPDLATLCDFLDEAQQIYLSHGITTAQDGMVGQGEFYQLKTMAEQKRLVMDVVGYLNQRELATLAPLTQDYRQKYRDRFKIGGYKIFLDGSPQGRTAWLSQPYVGGDDRGYPIYDDQTVTQFAAQAIDDNMQLLAHCNGDAAADQFIASFAQAAADRQGDWRPVMVHAQLVRPDQLQRMEDLGMIPSFFAAHVHYWGDIHRQNLGQERAASISPAATAAQLGLPFTLHQDSPVLPPDMLDTLWCVTNRRTKSGVLLGQAEAIDVYQGLKAITINAAYQYFEEKDKGSLKAGKRADLVILSDNPLTIGAENLRQIKVLATIKDGRAVYRAQEA